MQAVLAKLQPTPEMPIHSFIRMFAGAAVTFVGLTGCAAGGASFRTAEGPYLSPGPLPASEASGLRASPAVPAGSGSASSYGGPVVAAVTPGIPAGFTASAGAAKLPGAGMPGIGPVHGLVVPVSLGPRVPLRDDGALQREFFSAGAGGAGPTLVDEIGAISGGLFRPSFDVLPSMVDSRTNVLPTSPTPRQLMEFAESVLRAVARTHDLSRWDNDGPDGIPSSQDDDGRLDFVLLVVESDEGFPSMSLRAELPLVTPSGKTVNTGAVHLLSLPRREAADLRPAIGLWLDGLGLDPGERFFPTSFERGISSLARARLGWLPVQPVLSPARTAIPDSRALLFPLQDVGNGGGFWLVERAADLLYVSRVARKEDGHFFATEAHAIRDGRQVLALTRQFGDRGPHVVVDWPPGSEPTAEMVNGPSAASPPVPVRRPGR